MDIGAGKLFVRHNGGDWVDIADCTEFSVDFTEGKVTIPEILMSNAYEFSATFDINIPRVRKTAQWKQDRRFRFGGRR